MTDLTILIATRDRPQALELTLQSIVDSARRAPTIETQVVVVDDSDEGTAKSVADRLGVSYRRNPRRGGGRSPSFARAWALGSVNTEFVEFFDDDDLMLPEHVGSLEAAKARELDVCATGYWTAEADPVDPTRLIRRERRLLREPKLGDMLRGYQSVNDQAFVRMAAARDALWEPTRENTMLYWVWLQLILAGRRFGRTGLATFLYRQHHGSLSRTLEASDAEKRRSLLLAARREAVDRFGHVPRPSANVGLHLALDPLVRAYRRRRPKRGL